MKTISLLKSDDFKEAFHIEQRSHAFPWSESTFISNQGINYLNYRINCVGKMAGFAITQTVLDEATLLNVAIDPNFQRRGLGSSLISYLIEELKKQGTVVIWLEVRVSNLPAITLYENLGFNTFSVRHDYYPSPNGREDAFLMGLSL